MKTGTLSFFCALSLVFLLTSCGCENEDLLCPGLIPGHRALLKSMENDTIVFENEFGKRITVYNYSVSHRVDNNEACITKGLGQCFCFPCESSVNMNFASVDSSELFWAMNYYQVYDVETESWNIGWHLVLGDTYGVSVPIPIRQSALITKEKPSTIGSKDYTKAFMVKTNPIGGVEQPGHVYFNSKVGLIGFLDVRSGTLFSRVD